MHDIGSHYSGSLHVAEPGIQASTNNLCHTLLLAIILESR